MNYTKESNVSRRWGLEEDEIIRNAVAQYEKMQEDINWHAVASNLPGRNNKDCRKRWVYNLAPSINKGAWTEEEDKLLMEGIKQHGFRWPAVAQVVGSRQPDQCSRRWRESLNPDISHDRWSLQEDETLKEAVQIYGRKWTEIVERFLPNRTPIAAKKRYAKRFQRKQRTRMSKFRKSVSSDPGQLSETIHQQPRTEYDLENVKPELDVEPSPLLWHAIDYSQGNPDISIMPTNANTGLLSPPSPFALKTPELIPDLDNSEFQYSLPYHPKLLSPNPVGLQPNAPWPPETSFLENDSDGGWGWNQRGSFSECASDPGWGWMQNAKMPGTPISLCLEDPLGYSDAGMIEQDNIDNLMQSI